ncbi:MAG: heme-binding protein [Deltaproteobacteria bacterium]|jgi:uncharacterized protein GlcG (DUF336 family)|nr:heme-binding protein [Deltaproteobacteria bacterium]
MKQLCRFLILTLVLVLAAPITPVMGKDDPGKGLYLPGDVTVDLAQIAIAAALAKAQEQGTLMDIAIVDAGNNLKAFCRMDGAFLASIDISIKKAKSARGLNMPTSTLHDAAVHGGELYGIEVTNEGMVIFGGGELLKDQDGTIIGAIGVSGSSVANDMAVAQAGAAAVLAATAKK